MSKKEKSAEEAYYENRSKWIDAVFDDPDMSHADFKVLYFIAKRSGFKNRGMYWPVTRIAERCQCSTHTVSLATRKAAKRGWLRVTQNSGRENFYALNFYWL